MTQLQNSERRYGPVAIALHWLTAFLLSALVALSLYMTRLPDVGFDTWKIRLILCHKQLGILALMLVALRLLWGFRCRFWDFSRCPTWCRTTIACSTNSSRYTDTSATP
jgi:cytochrome b561